MHSPEYVILPHRFSGGLLRRLRPSDLGDIGICVADDETTAEIGFTLEPAAQGRGIATAAIREAIHLLFAATKVQQVIGITDDRNLASIRLLERIGFHCQEKRRAVFRGEKCSEKIYLFTRNGAVTVRRS